MRNSIIYLLFIAILLTQCKNNQGKEEESVSVTEQPAAPETLNKVTISDAQYRSLGITTGSLEKKNLKAVVKASGLLKLPPQNQADVSTFIGGMVKSIYVIEGTKVSKGQTLATLEHPDFTKLQEDYIKTKNNLEYLEKEFKRQEELYHENVGAGKVFQQAENNYKSEQSKLNSLKDQLQKISISIKDLNQGKITSAVPVKSPINGFVTHVYVNTGSFAQAASKLFEVVDNSHLHAELQIYEQDWYKVKPKQKVIFSLPSQPDKKVEGEVFSIGKSFDPQSKTLPVHAEILNTENLITGIYVNGYIDIGAAEVATLPEEAVISSGGKSMIFLEDKREAKDSTHTFSLEGIRTGVSNMGFTEIIPLEKEISGDNIVKKGSYYLWSKLKQEQEGEEE